MKTHADLIRYCTAYNIPTHMEGDTLVVEGALSPKDQLCITTLPLKVRFTSYVYLKNHTFLESLPIDLEVTTYHERLIDGEWLL